MNWWYAEQNQRRGPVEDTEFRRLIDTGVIGRDTLVWREGMANWVPYHTLDGPPPLHHGGREIPMAPLEDEPAIFSEMRHRCAECGRLFPDDELVRYGESRVCAACKPIFFQRIREGSAAPREFDYGGFWIRFAARIIDSVILMIPQILLFILVMPSMMDPTTAAPTPGFAIYQLLSFVFPAAYETFFLGRFGATPGKMACGLRVVRPDGTPITYLRGFARYFAQLLSGLILMVGYIMAAFDREKRALHDHICDTRVIAS